MCKRTAPLICTVCAMNMFLFDWQILVKIIVGKVENVEYLSKLEVPPQSLLH